MTNETEQFLGLLFTIDITNAYDISREEYFEEFDGLLHYCIAELRNYNTKS